MLTFYKTGAVIKLFQWASVYLGPPIFVNMYFLCHDLVYLSNLAASSFRDQASNWELSTNVEHRSYQLDTTHILAIQKNNATDDL